MLPLFRAVVKFCNTNRLLNSTLHKSELLFAMFKPLIGHHSIQFANDGRGRKMRNVLDQSFSHHAIASYTSIFNEVSHLLMHFLWF